MTADHRAALSFAETIRDVHWREEARNLAAAYLELRERVAESGQRNIEAIDRVLDEMLEPGGVVSVDVVLLAHPPLPSVEVVLIDTPEKAMEHLGYVPDRFREPQAVTVFEIAETDERKETG